MNNDHQTGDIYSADNRSWAVFIPANQFANEAEAIDHWSPGCALVRISQEHVICMADGTSRPLTFMLLEEFYIPRRAGYMSKVFLRGELYYTMDRGACVNLTKKERGSHD